MADNMIELVAKLNTDESEAQIKKDLNIISKALGTDSLKIFCSIDQNSIKKIQSQIDNLSRGIKLNIGTVGNGKINNIVDEKAIKNQAKALTDALDLALPKGKVKETRDVIQGLINDYQKALNSGDYNKLTLSFENLENYVNQFRKDVQYINSELVETQQNINAIAKQGKTFVSDSDFKELSFLLGGDVNARNLLGQAFGVGKKSGWTKDISKATTSWDMKIQTINDLFDSSRANKLLEIDSGKFNDHIDGVIQLVNYLNKSFDQGEELVSHYGQEIQKELGDQLFTELNKVLGISNQIDNEWEEIFNPNEVQETTQEVQKLGDALQQTLNTYPDISIGTSTKDTLESAKNVLNEYFTASGLDGEANRIKRAVEDTTGELERFYIQVERNDKSVETLTYAINAQGDAYEYLGKTIREADNSTDFRRKGLDVQKQIQAENLKKFIAQVNKSGVATDSLNERINNLKENINKIDDTNGMNAFLDDLDIAKAQFQSLNAVAREKNFAETLKNKIEKLSATMAVFAEKNERAVKSVQLMSSGKTFAQEWQELSDTLSKGNLSSDELKHLQERFAIFGKEAEAAGLKGKTAWEKFLNTFKTFSSYITANMVFNTIKREISKMVQEVINLDSSMTELKKVTEATDEEFNKFLETAKQSAQYLGSSVTDLVDATSTFSRLGYSLSDAQILGEIATLYKNVGDGIDISTASESIVSTLKAFKIEAEDAISIVDKFNEVGNNFAISSGGIGEALLRSASALATANNDLSQSIALITTANTIAQNPEMVGTGLKTMALRLRSTKTEIEEMGEDAEGAAENVSKLRDQVLALTKNKVDIQLDENTYKSSYQILLEISKVWNELNDISQASLLEQLFGKRQANVGAAILENGDLLEEVYKKAEESMGSAAKEQEKLTKSIQYSIKSFKAAYQSLASDLVKSEFVKAVVDFGSNVIKGLDFIISKTGVLQGILVGFGSLAIFKTIPALITKIKTLGTSLAAFGAIMNTLGASGGGGQIMTLQQLSLASKQLTDRQFELVLSTKSLTDAQLTAMMQARGFTQEQINAQLAIRNQTIATNGLAAAERGATATTFTLSGAIKGLGAAIAANPIGAIVTAVTLLATALTSLKRKREEAIVEAKRLEEERQQNLQTTVNEIKSLENEQDSIDGLIKRYTTLYNTTENIASKKDELTSITEELNEKFGNEKTQIDLVNKSLSENIELIREQQIELDKQWQRDNKDALKEAEDYVANNSNIMPAFYRVNGVNTGEGYDEAVKEAEFYFNRMKHLIDENDADLWNYLDTVEEVTTDKYGYAVTTYGFKLKEGLDKDVIPEVLKSFRGLYEQLDQYSYIGLKWFGESGTRDMESLNQYIDDWEKYTELLQKNESINNELWENTSASMDGTIERFNELVNTASEASRKMNADDALPADVYIYSRQIEEIRQELEELAKSSPELQKRFELIFSSIGLVSEDVSESADLLKKTFFDSLDEMEKGVFDKVDKINEAITKMLSGETLSASDAWDLLELDTTGILNPIIDANGEWIMQTEELVALKERLVGLSREQVQADLEAAQRQVTELDKQINEQYGIIKTQEEIIARQARGNTKPNEDNVKLLSQAKSKVNELLEVQKKYSEEVKRDNLLLQELNNRLRLSVEQAQKVADAYAKAYVGKIDDIIDGLEDELDTLNDQKDALNDQLDVLEAQQDELEDMISKYKDIAGIIEDEINNQIDLLKEQQQAEEDVYNARIEALKQEKEERQDAFEYAQKLANLENAKNNKVRVIDETRGFRYESKKEDVVKAENELADFETEQAIKAIEKERDAVSESFEAQIKEYEEYLKNFKDIQEEETKAENERLMTEEMGSDWREQIKNKDTNILTKYQTNFRNYNSQLSGLVNNEIASLKKSITAKENEIKTKQKQIQTWKDYKTTVEDAITKVDEKYDEYTQKLNDVNLAEDNRETSLQTFVTTYEGYVQQIQGLQNELSDKTVGLYLDTNVDDIQNKFDELIKKTLDWAEVFVEVMKSNDPELAQKALEEYAKASTNGYASGGTVDYTGLAMVHGRKNAPETVFNASDSKKLYDLVHSTPNLMADMMTKATKLSGFNFANTGNTSNSSVSIGAINVYANNPTELANGLDKQLDKYFQTKLTSNYTRS